MTIYEDVKVRMLEARKSRNSALTTLYATLIGEADMKAVMINGAKIVSDDDMISLIKSWIKKYDEMIDKGDTDTQIKALAEKAIILEFLPKQLTREEIYEKMMVSEYEVVSDFMKMMKHNFSGVYDGKIASEVAREVERKKKQEKKLHPD